MSTHRFSVVIPVYNRPMEVEELLNSLTHQDLKDFEVVIVEDGSKEPCEDVVNSYSERLSIQYFYKDNSGPGLTRNYGAARAKGEYLLFFDSDCIIPSHYMSTVSRELSESPADAFGGPDRAHVSFTPIQKAINYSMTSLFTTGGIRGGKHSADRFFPRSFNMGFTRDKFNAIGGFGAIRFGEDVDLSTRAIKQGLKVRLIADAWVYHKRRTDFRKFFKQVYCSGLARITLHLLHPGTLKLVHLLPSVFTIVMSFFIITSVVCIYSLAIPAFFSLVVFIDSFRLNLSVRVAALSIVASWVQLYGYGAGFLASAWKRLVLQRREHSAFSDNFYE